MTYTHGGNVYEIGRTLGIKGSELKDFSANINPLGLCENVRAAMIKAIDKITKYPDITYYEVKKAICDYDNLDLENLILGNGAAEVIFNVTRAIKPKKALIPAPTFSEYEDACKSIDCNVQYYFLNKENNFHLEEDFLNKINEDIDILFICNPNNPTGVLTEKSFIEKVLKKAEEKSVYVVVDESFLDFVKNGQEYSVLDQCENFKNLIVIKSATKFFAVPGIRIGYGYSKNNDFLNKINKITVPWSINTIACDGLVVALKEKDYIEKTIDFIDYEKEYLYTNLKSIDKIEPLKPAVNFIMFKVNNDINLYDELLKENIVIRRCGNYKNLSDNYYRVAVRTREENDILTANLKRIMEAK